MVAGGGALIALAMAIAGLLVMGAARSEYREDMFALKELQRAVQVLDAQLTTAAQLYAERGEARWIAGYDEGLAELNAAIEGLAKMAPGPEAARLGRLLSASNAALAEMETAAFAEAEQGRLRQAQAIIFSQDYETQKKAYADALDALSQAVALQLDARLQRFETHGPAAAAWIVLALLMMAVSASRFWRFRKEQVAEIRARELALEATRNRLKEAMAFVDAAVFEIDFVNRHVINDDSTKRMFGRALQFSDLVGRGRGMGVAHDDDAEAVAQAIAASRAANSDRLTIEFRLKGAEPARWIAMHGLIERDEGGAPIRCIEFAQDITASKLRELALAQAKEESSSGAARLGLALDAFGAVVWEIDLVDQRIVNAEGLRPIFGCIPSWADTFIGEGGLHHRDDWVLLSGAVARLYAGEQLAPIEHRVIWPDGAIAWVQTGMRCLFSDDGAPRRLIMVSCDITQRRSQLAEFGAAMERAELALKTKRAMLEEMGLDVGATTPAASEEWRHRAGIGALFQRLDRLLAEIDARDAALAEALMAREEAREAAEAANTAKSQFLANMSHELRTPLNAVIGYAEILDEDLEDAGLEPQRKDLARIRNAARHLLSLINEVLDLSKIEAGRMDVTPEAFSLVRTVMDAVDTITPAAAANGNEVRLTIEASIDQAFTDQQKLKQCLLNLMSNAAKFTKQGMITVDVSRRANAVGDVVDIRVADSGIGMSPEQLARLFQPFVQADASTSRAFGGTGLGLAITRRLMQLIGGDVMVASRQGEGSVFTLSLPLVYEAQSHDDHSGGTRGGPVVLVIDDSAEVRDLARRALSRLGYDVRGAATVAEGLRACRTQNPAAVVLDVGLPDGSGWDLLAELKRNDTTRAIPVIMHTIEDDATRSLSLGAVMHLRKPVGRAELAATVTRFAALRVQSNLAEQRPEAENGERLAG
jgi:signal transduction histidine kinase/ActR/RegA family two-component response regulator